LSRQARMQEAEQLDGSGRRFLVDRWQRGAAEANTGFGITAVLEGGALLEKVGRPGRRRAPPCLPCCLPVSQLCPTYKGLMQGAVSALSCSYTPLFLHTLTDLRASRGGAHWLVPGRARRSAAAAEHAARSLAGGRERVCRARDAVAGARARHVRARAARRGRAGCVRMARPPLGPRAEAHRGRRQQLNRSWCPGCVWGGWKASRRGCPCNTVADSAPAAGGQPYSAAALSLVFHPAHPHVPTLRADVRRFEARCQAGARSGVAHVCA